MPILFESIKPANIPQNIKEMILVSKAFKNQTRQVQPFSTKPGAFKVVDSGDGEDSFHGLVLIVNKSQATIMESFDFDKLVGLTILGA